MKPGDARICPSCGARNKAKWEICVRCGASLEDVPIADAPAAGTATKPAKPSVRVNAPQSAGWSISWVTVVGFVALVGASVAAYRSLHGPPSTSTGDTASLFTAPTVPPARPSNAPGPVPNAAAAKTLKAASARIGAGDLAGALPMLAQAVAEDPDNAEAHHLYGLALRRTGSNEEALVHFRAAARLLPDSLQYRTNLAKALVEAGQAGEAIETYEAVLKSRPDSPSSMQQLAEIHAAAGNYEQALPLLTRAAEIAPNKADLQEEVGFALEKTGRTEAAKEAYQRALEADPKAALGRSRLAEMIFTEGRKDEAVQMVRTGLQQNPQSPELHRSLGSLLERSGNVREAITAYREYARLAPGAADAQEVSERAAELEKRAARSRS
jgi:tetratricopeptide (TPR) repeat protein